ncbi:DUF4258 domain-containing protein [Roseateles sp. UC29_93]|uniref:DUF4258 domain-containing protein n=1 Tax=Roseateles sp. UC29_93 TaxID=3350177 RepID=UPI00366C37AE
MTFKKQTRDQLERHIRQTAGDVHNIVITGHAFSRMRQRGVLAREVFACLQTGRIDLPPEEDMKTGRLICRMQRYGTARNLAVCVGLDDDDPKLLVITVIV